MQNYYYRLRSSAYLLYVCIKFMCLGWYLSNDRSTKFAPKLQMQNLICAYIPIAIDIPIHVLLQNKCSDLKQKKRIINKKPN